MKAKNKKLQRSDEEATVKLPGETDSDYFKRCREESDLLASCDYGIDEEAQDRILGQDPESEGEDPPQNKRSN